MERPQSAPYPRERPSPSRPILATDFPWAPAFRAVAMSFCAMPQIVSPARGVASPNQSPTTEFPEITTPIPTNRRHESLLLNRSRCQFAQEGFALKKINGQSAVLMPRSTVLGGRNGTTSSDAARVAPNTTGPTPHGGSVTEDARQCQEARTGPGPARRSSSAPQAPSDEESGQRKPRSVSGAPRPAEARPAPRPGFATSLDPGPWHAAGGPGRAMANVYVRSDGD